MSKDYLTSPLNDKYSSQLSELREKIINSPGMKIMLENQEQIKRWGALSPKRNPDFLAMTKIPSYEALNRTIKVQKDLISSTDLNYKQNFQFGINQTIQMDKLRKSLLGPTIQMDKIRKSLLGSTIQMDEIRKSLLSPTIQMDVISKSISLEALNAITESQRNQFNTQAMFLEKTFNPVNVPELIADIRGLPRKPYDSSLQDFVNKYSEEAVFIDDKDFTPYSVKDTHNEIVKEPIAKLDTPISNQDIYDLFSSYKSDIEQIKSKINQYNASPSKKEQIRHDAKNMIVSSAVGTLVPLLFSLHPFLTIYLLTMAYVIADELLKEK